MDKRKRLLSCVHDACILLLIWHAGDKVGSRYKSAASKVRSKDQSSISEEEVSTNR
jgi:hypothetical protein